MTTALLCLALLVQPAQADAPVVADVVLRNATLVDGTGKPAERGDLAIKGDRIVAVGKFRVQGSPRVLDCTGLVVAPGFIDLHTHSDNPLQKSESAPALNYLTQGVTTSVTGNCGAGPVDTAAYYAAMEKLGVGTNVAHQVPHNAVRNQVMGNADRTPTAAELKKMEALVEKGMRDGAWGMATGLIYNPGTYSKTDELVALSKAVARLGGLYASHIRNESTEILAAIEEILEICRRAGLRVHISHIKVSGPRAWGMSGQVIARIRRARKEGMEVTADQYPYTASSTSLAATVIPTRWREGSAKDLLARLDDPRVIKDIGEALEIREGGRRLKIASYAPRPDWQGLDLETIAKKEKRPVLDLVLEIQKKGGAAIVNFGMSEEDVRLYMKEPYVATASDGSAQVPSTTVPHPRSYGTFPRKIGHYCLKEKILSLEQGIRSCSGLPADILRLPQRGYLKVGYFADVVVFDPKTLRDVATFDAPHQYSTGVVHLFVNGQPAIAEGRYTGARAGRVLRFVPVKKGS